MKKHRALFALLGLAALLAMRSAAEDKEKDVKKTDSRIFELRTYYAAPGKMDALNARFRNNTIGLFKKHGMEVIGFWTDEKRPEVLIYILAFPSKDAADKSWKEFLEDPDWIKAKADSEKDGALTTKIERVFMNPTEYSPIK
jgi:hypothetical protein